MSRDAFWERHFDRASDLAAMVDCIAGADEAEAGRFYEWLLSTEPPETRHIVQQLIWHADTLRAATRTAH
ncbi:hypothetical protein [Bradyrhizobium sp. USDA 4508]